MATVVYQRCGGSECCDTIPCAKQKSLNINDYNEERIKRYNMPQKWPEPPTISDVSVLDYGNQAVFSQFSSKIEESIGVICNNNIIYVIILCRGKHRGNMSVPSWAAFNSLLSNKDIPLTTVKHFPFIHAPPSDLSTIYTALITLVKVAEKLGQSHILVTADLAIYSKAQQILWDKPEILDGKLTMRLGGVHLNMAFIAAMGKLFGDGGLWAF